MRGSLTKKFVIILIVGTAVAIVCATVFGYYHAHNLRCIGAGETMERVAESQAEKIDIAIDAAIKSLAQLASSKELAEALADKREAEALAAFAAENPGFKNLRVTTRPGAAASGGPVVGEPAPGESLSVHISTPVVPATAAGIRYDLECDYTFQYVLIRPKQGRQELIALFSMDSAGRRFHVLAPPERMSARPTDFRLRGSEAEPVSPGHASVTLEPGGLRAIAGFSPLKHPFSSAHGAGRVDRWSVVVAIPEIQVIGPLNTLFFRALGFSAAMLVLVSVGGLALARRILRPIRVLQGGVQEIGQGNLEHRIDVRSGDEIEMLAVEFNRMAERMQRTQEQLQRRSKELEQRVNQLRRLQAQLMQSERMAATGELAAQIAHEINNPLGIIKNYVGIAKMLMGEEDSNRENMKIIDQEINRIAGIVRRLLKFAKPGAEDIQPVQINQVLEELLALLRGQLFRKKIEVSAELAENLPEVNVSTDQMRQVFLNLIKNAEDAMPDGGKLTIRTRYRKGRVEIDIADSGAGIAPENIKNIFEPFYTTKGVKGTGLGLSVSYGIIKNYNGEISVDSEPDKGATFTIQLPVVSERVFQVIQSP